MFAKPVELISFIYLSGINQNFAKPVELVRPFLHVSIISL